MIPGIVASQGGVSSFVPAGAIAHLDFRTGEYWVGGTVSAAAVVSDPELIGAGGLALPDNDQPVVDMIGDLLTLMLAGSWTVACEFETLNTSRSYPLSLQNNDWSHALQVEKSNGGGIYVYDKTTTPFHQLEADDQTPVLAAGVHRFALTRTGSKLALSKNGEAVVSEADDTVAATWTTASFGGFSGDYTYAPINIRVFTVYAALPDASLPALSA